jgi:chromosome segregation ATPase
MDLVETIVGREVNVEHMVEDDGTERRDNVEERRFKIGELVEFWETALARGNRTDSGDPAWVKADHGGGEYGIKMVTNTRGKLRRVQWKQLYKDGSFNNKLQIGAVGARVRTTERMREIERDKAEAKFAGKVKEKEQELKLAEKEINDTQEQADRSLRQRDMQARQAEKDLSVGHKRSLLEMSVALEKKRKIDVRGLEELDRDNRIKTRELEKKLKDMQETLSVIQGEKLELERAVKRGKERLVVLRDFGDGWKTKYTEHKETGAQKMEEQIRELENGQKDKVKQIRAVERKCTLLEDRCTSLEDKLQEREHELEEVLEERRQVNLLPFPSLFLCFILVHLKCIVCYTDRQERNKRNETSNEKRRCEQCWRIWAKGRLRLR